MVIDETKYKSNSNIATNKEKKEIKKIADGKIKKEKMTLSKKFATAFISDESINIKDHIIFNVLIPTIKDTIYEIGTGILEMSLFGEDSSCRRSKKLRYDKSSYYNYYDNKKKTNPNNKNINNIKSNYRGSITIELDFKEECQDVIESLLDLIEEYGVATVGDLNEMIGITGEFTDEGYGWTNLIGRYSIKRIKGSYILELPKPKNI